MKVKAIRMLFVLFGALLLLVACGGGETFVSPTEAPPASPVPPTETSAPVVEPTEEPMDESGAAAYGVHILGAWVDAGSPETDPFDYEGVDGNTYQGTFEVDIQPLFTTAGAWFENSPPCTSCHFGANENSAHEMDLSSFAGILSGADTLEAPPGVSILGESGPGAGDYSWEGSELRKRLRDNRMPPGFPFDITEENRDGPTLTINGTGVRAVDLIGAWVEAGVPETDPFGEYGATFEENVLPLFTENNAWFEGSQACTGCHFGNNENSAHEMDLTSYAGILSGADSLEDPPGASILGESSPGAGDYNWDESELRARLRDNRMPAGAPFDPTEANRDGLLVLHGAPVAMEGEAVVFGSGECEVKAVDLVGFWVDGGSPESESFDFTAVDGTECEGTFEVDVLPLFTAPGAWFTNSPNCTSCHFGNTETSAHEMDLSTHAGILTGADALEAPPGVSVLGESGPGAGDFNWEESELRKRLRDNRMPPGMPFDITEENRDGPTLTINGMEVRAVDLIGAWVDAGVPETDPFGEYNATFETDVLPLFTTSGLWYQGAQACSGCHFANTENSAHEMDLSSYAGILAGADVLEEPPGVSILGESGPGVGDYSWEESELRARLRDNRMPPGFPFDITEANRDGPTVLAGVVK